MVVSYLQIQIYVSAFQDIRVEVRGFRSMGGELDGATAAILSS